MNLGKILTNESQSLIIAEIGQNHDGSLGMAHSYIDACADIGVNAIKFQTHIASEESSVEDQFRINFSYEDDSRYDYWKRMEFSKEQWIELKNHAEQRNIIFLSTPFSLAAVKMLIEIGIEGWKIGSGDTSEDGILSNVIETKLPLILSTGMSRWSEIDNLVNNLKNKGANFCLMQCTSKYPTSLEEVGINILSDLKRKYSCRVGLSDHSGSISPSLFAIAQGFNVIEIHATFDRRMFGPDIKSSLTIDEIQNIVNFAEDINTMNENPVEKDKIADELSKQRKLFGRSLTYNQNFLKGHILKREDLSLKKPGTGIPMRDIEHFLGKKLNKNVKINRLLKKTEIEW